VTYIFMAVHYPAPGRLEEIHASMRRMAESAAGTPGLLEIGPWLDRDRTRVVGVSKWESREAFEAAMPGSGVPNEIIHPGESKPREYFHLESPT
jgi:quinol monooxygenase YgiN